MAKIHIPTPMIPTTSVVAWTSEPSEEELEVTARMAAELDNYGDLPEDYWD